MIFDGQRSPSFFGQTEESPKEEEEEEEVRRKNQEAAAERNPPFFGKTKKNVADISCVYSTPSSTSMSLCLIYIVKLN